MTFLNTIKILESVTLHLELETRWSSLGLIDYLGDKLFFVYTNLEAYFAQVLYFIILFINKYSY